MSAPRPVWVLRAFDDLTARQVHDLLRLRSQVFVVEQNCVFLDMDGVDPRATHLLAYRDGELVACARWYEGAHGLQIGRIVTSPAVRGRGWGRALMREAMTHLEGRRVVMHAQSHLERFYGEFGFVRDGADFLEDGIPHTPLALEAGTL